jgi:putative transposase
MTTFSNTAERDTYPSEAKAAMTLAEVEKWLATFLVDVYQERPHSALGISPRERYEQGILGEGNRASYPRRCLDETRLRLDFLPFEKHSFPLLPVVQLLECRSDLQLNILHLRLG